MVAKPGIDAHQVGRGSAIGPLMCLRRLMMLVLLLLVVVVMMVVVMVVVVVIAQCHLA